MPFSWRVTALLGLVYFVAYLVRADKGGMFGERFGARAALAATMLAVAAASVVDTEPRVTARALVRLAVTVSPAPRLSSPRTSSRQRSAG